MPRPRKSRRVAFIPQVNYFKPAGIPLRALDEVQLSVEEAEALRLKDLEGLEQEEGADKMNVSRATFQRILVSARRKTAEALLNGKALKIEGGNYEMAWHRYRCFNGHEWDLPSGIVAGRTPETCPMCSNKNVEQLVMPIAGKKERRYGKYNK